MIGWRDKRELEFCVHENTPLKKVVDLYILFHLKRCGWHRGKAVKALGISQRTIDRRMADFGVTTRVINSIKSDSSSEFYTLVKTRILEENG